MTDAHFRMQYSIVVGVFIALTCLMTGCTVYVIHDTGLSAADSISQHRMKPAPKTPPVRPAPTRYSHPIALNP